MEREASEEKRPPACCMQPSSRWNHQVGSVVNSRVNFCVKIMGTPGERGNGNDCEHGFSGVWYMLRCFMYGMSCYTRLSLNC